MSKRSGILVFASVLVLLSCDLHQVHMSEPISERGSFPLPIEEGVAYKTGKDQGATRAKPTTEARANWEVIEPLLQRAQQESGSELVALFGVMDSTGGFYHYRVQPLAFSGQAVEEADGRLRPYLYEIVGDKAGKVTTSRIAVAYIPDSERAAAELTRWVKPKQYKTIRNIYTFTYVV